MRRLSTTAAARYTLTYFNSRGAAEPIRLLLALSGEPWHDIRYPMAAARGGFTLAKQFLKDREAGAFAVNMGSLPVLDVRGPSGDVQRLGQSHAIARFLARSHELMGSTPEEAAAVDLLYECVRDIKTRWFRVKATKDAPDNDGEAGAARRDAKRRWWTSQMPEACEQLEGALLAASPASESPWLVGDALSLADVAVYHLLSTPTSVASGSCVGFFDGEAERVRAASAPCSRLSASVHAFGALPAVREWERRRPDTFS